MYADLCILSRCTCGYEFEDFNIFYAPMGTWLSYITINSVLLTICLST